MTRTNQRGSVLGYVVIGGILALLLIGGIFFAKRQSVSPDTTKAPSVAKETDKPTTSEPKDQDKKPEGFKADSKPAEHQHEETATHKADKQVTKELPKTGLSDVGAVVIVGTLAFVGVSYVQSRRQMQSL